ncbi:MAG: hypothetical protein ABFS19_09625 [Thermodesulfobacteriota bacterium]
MTRFHLLAIDLQKEFTEPGGFCYQPRPCVDFITETLLPYCLANGLQIAEIISDYRQPRLTDQLSYCIPGSEGYQSIIAAGLRNGEPRVKSTHSPAWVREKSEKGDAEPGLPVPDPAGLDSWFSRLLGPPDEELRIVLIGLTLDCCILSTAQELHFRGYHVRYLVEAVDTYDGSIPARDFLLRTTMASWGEPLSWRKFLKMVNGGEESS